MAFLSVGVNSFANSEEILAVIIYKGSAAQRMRSLAENTGRYIPVSGGRKTRSLIIFSNGFIMGSRWNPSVIANRANMTMRDIVGSPEIANADFVEFDDDDEDLENEYESGDESEEESEDDAGEEAEEEPA